MINENMNVLEQKFPFLYEQMKNHEFSSRDHRVEIIDTKSGLPTLCYKNAENQVFIHSKYNPADEASKLMSRYSDVSRYKHVFFFGIGLGYHIEAFKDKYPLMSISVYEPDKEILKAFMSLKSLNQLLAGRQTSIYTGDDSKEVYMAVSHFVNMISGEVLFVILPSYERIFGDKYKLLLEAFKIAVTNKRASLKAQASFQKLWTANCIKNFREVIYSPNLLKDKRQYFEGKPVILAAAGPSLGEELENLRTIKERGLAYIFSVGSAINTLLANGIPPDAICIYDPGINTNQVIMKVKEQELDIPLVFGSSVHYGAVQGYPGRKLHIITSQDTISAYFLRAENGEELQKVVDAPSIAIIILQTLVMLGCSPIILAGQNFAFKNKRYYAEGIEYGNRPGELINGDMSDVVVTEDVDGGMVETSQLFNHMREQMEMYIENCGCRNIINTTKGGAKIKGTVYKPMEEIINMVLVHASIDPAWSVNQEPSYDIDYMVARGKLMEKEKALVEDLLDELNKAIVILRSEKTISLQNKALVSFESAYNRLVSNQFFNYVLKPMNRVQFEMIAKKIDGISNVRHISEKAGFIVETFSDIFECCEKDMASVQLDFDNILEDISENDIKVLLYTICIS